MKRMISINSKDTFKKMPDLKNVDYMKCDLIIISLYYNNIYNNK